MAVASASRGGHLLLIMFAAMHPSFSRFAFSSRWIAALFFAAASIAPTIASAHFAMMEPALRPLSHCFVQDSVVVERTPERPPSEKSKRKQTTERSKEKVTQKSKPTPSPVASHPVVAPVVVPQTTAPGDNMQVKGFRVQVYTGFSDRASRNAALQVQKDIRRRFPEIATYVHFISPRWICRVGNFTRREDAIHYARLIRAAHLSSEAAVVACPILVRRQTSLP